MRLFLYSSRSRMGREKAAVLPEPATITDLDEKVHPHWGGRSCDRACSAHQEQYAS